MGVGRGTGEPLTWVEQREQESGRRGQFCAPGMSLGIRLKFGRLPRGVNTALSSSRSSRLAAPTVGGTVVLLLSG